MDKTEAFLDELASLCHKHQLALEGNPFVYQMERDDHSLAYDLDAECRLQRTDAYRERTPHT